ncbi:MAG TPA: hypothetical protein VEA36_01190 [Candidatus Paceibacterota bacterium]|nr:hypothetical protein [Candidatus Paceibacterota bacterium]
MKYRQGRDRQVSIYLAALIITIFGSGMVLVIVRAISEVDFTSVAAVAI